MSYNTALRQAIADHLNNDYRRRLDELPEITPDDIEGIDVTWDSGERHDPTYGSSDTTPTFEISVRLRATTATRPYPAKVDVSFLFGALLNMLLETEL